MSSFLCLSLYTVQSTYSGFWSILRSCWFKYTWNKRQSLCLYKLKVFIQVQHYFIFLIFQVSTVKGKMHLWSCVINFLRKRKGGYIPFPPLILVPTKSLFSVHLKGILSALFCSESKIWNCWKDKMEFKIYKSLLCQLILPAITQTLNPGKKSFEKVLKTWKQISKGFDLVDLIGEQFGSLTNQINDYEFSSFEPIWI